MAIEEGNIVLLDNDQEYCLVKTLELNNKIYWYLVNIVNPEQLGYFEACEDNLTLVTDEDVIKQLSLIIFNETLKINE